MAVQSVGVSNIKISSRNCFSRRPTRKTTNLNIIFSIYFFDWTVFVSPNVYERRDSDLHHPLFWLFIVLRYICCSLLLLVVLSTNTDFERLNKQKNLSNAIVTWFPNFFYLNVSFEFSFTAIVTLSWQIYSLK